MRGMHRLVGLAGMALCVAAVAPATASAATTLGQTFPPEECGADTYIQTATPPGGPSYTAPSSGVVTQWSYQSDSTPPPTVRLKIAQNLGGGTLKIVAQSATENIAASTLNTYQSRISMPAGTDLGEFIGDDCSRENPAFTDFFADGDLSAGTTSSLFTQEDFQQDISAVLEPDADNDGFGDETQDQCPTDGSTQGACPVTPGTPGTSKCKHKKKHKSAVSAKKKCKKHKKHH